MEPTPTTAALLGEADFVRSLAGGLVYDPGAADDVAQETLLAALENPPAHLASTRGWLATVARNVARQMGRSRTRRTAREAKVARPEDAVPSTLELLEVEEVRGQVVEAVMSLDETDRSVVVLRYYEGLKPAAIAERMGLTANAVSSRLSRAHRKLREVLDTRHNGSRAAWVFALGPLLPTHPPAGVAPNDEPSPAPGRLSTSALMLSALAVLVAGTVALVPLMLSDEPAQPALADGDPAVQLPPPAPIDRGFDVEVPPRPSTDPPAAEDPTPRGSEPAPAEPPAAKPPPPPAFVPPANRRLRGRVLGWTHGAGESMRISVSPGESKSERAAAWIGPPKDRPRAHPNTLWKPAGGVERIRSTVAEDGTFELDLGRWWNVPGGPLPPPMLIATLHHSRYERGEFWLRLSDLEEEAAANSDAAAGARYWAELGVLQGPNTVVGTVQTADGTPIAGADVWLLSGKPGPQHLPGGASTRTDEQGRFRLLVKAGAKVAFAVNSEKHRPVRHEVGPVGEALRELEPITLATGETVRGRILLAGGSPLMGRTVTAWLPRATRGLGGGVEVDERGEVHRGTYHAVTDADGRFTFSGLSAVEYRFRTDVGRAWVFKQTLDTRITPPATLKPWIVQGAELRVQLRVAGQPIEGGHAWLERTTDAAGKPDTTNGEEHERARRDPATGDWRVDFGVVPPGLYTLTAGKEGHARSTITLRINAGDRVVQDVELVAEAKKPGGEGAGKGDTGKK